MLVLLVETNCFWCHTFLPREARTRDHMVTRPLRKLLRKDKLRNVIHTACHRCNQERARIGSMCEYVQRLGRTGTTLRADQIEQQIREKAYHLWERDGRPWGMELTFWVRAEAYFKNSLKRIKEAKRAIDKFCVYRSEYLEMIQNYRKLIDKKLTGKLREICLQEIDTVLSFES